MIRAIVALTLGAAWLRIRNKEAWRQHAETARELNATAATVCAEANQRRIRDIYDTLPPERAATLRRQNKERLAHLEAASAQRRARIRRATNE